MTKHTKRTNRTKSTNHTKCNARGYGLYFNNRSNVFKWFYLFSDLLEGQDDFVDFPDHEYSDELAAAANDDKAIIIEDPTSRSVDSDLTTTLSSTESEEK